MSYNALLTQEKEDGSFHTDLTQQELSFLPDHDTLIRVEWSSLNYKDALSAGGNKGITRSYPHQPGVDAAGRIVESPTLQKGTEVIVVGFDLGMNTPGGLGEFIRVPSEWVIPKPDGLSLKECMGIGTAGFTAAQCVMRLEQNGLTPEKGDVVVTGATGGVGSVAVSLLASKGYTVYAASRRPAEAEWLTDLGAAEIIDAAELTEDNGRPMLKGRWAGAVETVAGKTLEVLTKSMMHRGVITCCGMITGKDLHTTVFPFILRGLTLVGIDSAECPMEQKRAIWKDLGGAKPAHLDALMHEITLSDAPDALEQMINGKTQGRQIVRVS